MKCLQKVVNLHLFLRSSQEVKSKIVKGTKKDGSEFFRLFRLTNPDVDASNLIDTARNDKSLKSYKVAELSVGTYGGRRDIATVVLMIDKLKQYSNIKIEINNLSALDEEDKSALTMCCMVPLIL